MTSLLPVHGAAYLEKWCEDDSTSISKLKGRKQLWEDLVAAEVLWEGIQVGAELLEELLSFSWLLNLE